MLLKCFTIFIEMPGKTESNQINYYYCFFSLQLNQNLLFKLFGLHYFGVIKVKFPITFARSNVQLEGGFRSYVGRSIIPKV